MVSFRPLSRSLPLASRAALFHSCAPAPVLRHAAAARRAAPVFSKLGATATGSRSAPSSFRALTTAREKVKVLLVLYDGGKHAEQVSGISVLHSTPNWAGARTARLDPPMSKHHKLQARTSRISGDSYVKDFLCCSVASLIMYSAFASDDPGELDTPNNAGGSSCGAPRSTMLFLDLVLITTQQKAITMLTSSNVALLGS